MVSLALHAVPQLRSNCKIITDSSRMDEHFKNIFHHQ